MASNCFTPIRGRRMRVTRVDTLGRPVPGECSTVVTGGFVSVEMQAEIEEGEETTVRTAGGELCSLPGSLVRTIVGDLTEEIPIEKLFVSDRVVTWSPERGALRPEGQEITRVAEREYDGVVVRVTLPSGKSSVYTEDHRCLAIPADAVGADGEIDWSVTPQQVRACELTSGMHVYEVDGDAGRWQPAEVTHEPYAGPVYSLEVARDHTYIADGIATFNCISEKGADQLKWINVTIEFCNVDPDLFSMINPTWTKLLDRNGETIGWEESHDYSIDQGFALEMWSDVTGYTPTDPTAQGAWVYYLLPWVVGGTLGDITVENGAVSFTVTGRSKQGSAWAKGPYDVQANAPDGLPGPMITAFNPKAPRRIFLTTIRPPEPLCGCVPLSAPDGPNATVVEDTTDTTRMTIRAFASGAGPFTINWGDGSAAEDLTTGLTGETHQYGAAGTYNVQIYPTSAPTKVTYIRVTVPYTGTTPPAPLAINVTEVTSDATRRTAQVDWSNGTSGTVKVDWGDGTVLTGQAQTGTLTHQYASTVASYTLRVTDESDATRQDSEVVSIPWGPVLTLTEDTDDTDARTVIATVNNYGRGSVTINWGQVGAPTPTNAGNGVDESSYKYTTGGTYTVTATDTDDPTRVTTKNVTVPFP